MREKKKVAGKGGLPFSAGRGKGGGGREAPRRRCRRAGSQEKLELSRRERLLFYQGKDGRRKGSLPLGEARRGEEPKGDVRPGEKKAESFIGKKAPYDKKEGGKGGGPTKRKRPILTHEIGKGVRESFAGWRRGCRGGVD